MRDVVIAGGSIAGFSAAQALRQGGHDGSITIVAAEDERTYERPPLSKQVLTGADPASVRWSAAHDGELDIDWRLGTRATALDAEARSVALSDGSSLSFDGLVIATGARPRRLPGTEDVAGVHVVRSLVDATALRSDLAVADGPVVVIGAGFIGAEVAASCRALDLDVTLVEPMAQPMQRIIGDRLGETVASLHRERGVDVRLGVGVDEVAEAGSLRRVTLGDGTTIEAAVVVVGIGVLPNTDWLDGSGLPVGDGVEADATLQVAPGITAAGDVASWASPRYGRVRIEHWDHAVEMGQAAGRRLLVADDEAEPFDPVPWFWSEQYDVRIQVAGRTSADDEVRIIDGAIDDGKFVAGFGDDAGMRGVLAWNWPAKAVRYRMALADGLAWPS